MIRKIIALIIVIQATTAVLCWSHDYERTEVYGQQKQYFGGFSKPTVVMSEKDIATLAEKPVYREIVVGESEIDVAPVILLNDVESGKAGEQDMISEIISEEIKNFNLDSQTVLEEASAEEQIIDPVSTGWMEADVEAEASKIRKTDGVRRLIDLFGRLINGMGSAPIIPLTLASDGTIITTNAYTLGEEGSGSILNVLKHKIVNLAF
ncbi:MAG: hypothetical protein ABIH89_00910 [Elusimicrobiota bacterium]